MQGILDKKIPSLLGILIIVVGIASTTFLVERGQVFQTNAGPGDDPKNIQITNISDSAFTVTYITDAQVFGTIKVGANPDSLDQTFLDDRDRLSQKVSDYKTHSITVNNLTPSSTYYFTINSGNETTTNNGAPFNITTAPLISEASSLNSQIKGKVINPDGTVPTDGIILINTNGAQKKSGYLQKDGSYNIILKELRTDDLSNYFRINENTVLNMEVNSSDFTSKISTSSNNLSSLPTIVLPNNYDFSESKKETEKVINSSGVKFPEFGSKLKTSTSTIPSGTLTPTPSIANPSAQ